MLSVSEGRAAVSTGGDLLHVKLGTTRRARSMERNHLGPQQVLSWGNTGWNGNCVYAAVADNLRCAPVTCVVTILLNLEPVGCNMSDQLVNTC